MKNFHMYNCTSKILFLLIIILITSCSKSELISIDENKGNADVILRSLNLDQIDPTISEVFDSAYANYGVASICGCTCSNMTDKKEAIELFGEDLPYYGEGPDYFDSASCSVYKDIASSHCNFSTRSDHIDYVFEIMDTLAARDTINFMTSEELDLIRDVVNYIDTAKSHFIDYSRFEYDWENLNDKSSIDNAASIALIKLIFSGQNYMDDTPYFDTPGNPQGLAHKAVSIVGGFFGSMIVAAVWDTLDDYGLDGDDLLRTGVQGAIVGALT